jgi:subtilase family serine protease
MKFLRKSLWIGCKQVSILALLALLAVSAFAQAGQVGAKAQVLGAEDPSKQITVTMWLNQHNKAELDTLVRQIYDRNSPNYHHWLTAKEYQARFAPTASDVAVVRQYMEAHSLKVVYTDKFNHAVSARGAVADVERATGVQLNRVLLNGEEHRMPSNEPVISGAAGKLVYAVQGLTDGKYQNHAKAQVEPGTGKALKIPLSKLDPATQYFNANCLRAPQSRDFKGPGGAEAFYTGTRYGDAITSPPPNLPPCGYDAPQVEKAYGLTSLYSEGRDGTGQTVVIVDAYGSDTITSDANVFAEINGLPALTSSNFAIYYPTGPTKCGNATGPGCGWDAEVSIDVEWAHSVAPGASIALVVGLDNSFTSLDLAILFAIDTELGPVVSNSWGAPESELIESDPGELIVQNNIAETGAALGISVNFSSGDGGDYLAAIGAKTVEMPAAAPYATAIGGTSLFLNTNGTIKRQTGWGTNLTRIATYAPNPPIIPPDFIGFYFGAGGGASAYWPKPSYQSSLSGTWRLLPDIAWLADPYTGGEIIDTESGTQFIAVYGGTSLACPMFSGIWAIATQAAGTWLGQAAPILYTLPAGAITDIAAVEGPDNVSGYTHVPGIPNVHYTSAELLAPVQVTDFIGALYNGTTTRWYAISFGTDSSLATGPGWDDVTGLGTPNGLAFVAAVAEAQ